MEKVSFENMPAVVTEILNKVERLEVMIKNLQQIGTVESELLNVQEAAAFLKMSVPAIYTKVSRREIPVSKPGRRLYFSKLKLMEWISASKLKTQNELLNDAQTKMKEYRKRFGS
ncbi:helix-turn-helix domain-containing protein [Pedobacter petrophilus]|uniref:Helix-turn-helix domain-containing protein n=1 Tax=Pedobacter petrophilus TaxID=1908241 RepID=A0A7K0FZY5_9SPHI|nr:helix-turn-helix domain-containing protein [Pedobacter petrophilus]MRX76529.1 helix-turn-helix domain-containing protein [Pedobacter petrophilus]